jgi:hypothetical protein
MRLTLTSIGPQKAGKKTQEVISDIDSNAIFNPDHQGNREAVPFRPKFQATVTSIFFGCVEKSPHFKKKNIRNTIFATIFREWRKVRITERHPSP